MDEKGWKGKHGLSKRMPISNTYKRLYGKEIATVETSNWPPKCTLPQRYGIGDGSPVIESLTL
jgi:hypothetical protein